MAILGIDTGLKGALALWKGDFLEVYDMPVKGVQVTKDKKKNRVDVEVLSKIIADMIDINIIDYAVIESTTPFTSARSGVPASTYHLMGINEGLIMGVLSASSIPYHRVLARTWKKELSCPKDKNGARDRASEIFPSHSEKWKLKKHDGRAEAAMIAYYSTIIEKESSDE